MKANTNFDNDIITSSIHLIIGSIRLLQYDTIANTFHVIPLSQAINMLQMSEAAILQGSNNTIIYLFYDDDVLLLNILIIPCRSLMI